MQSLALEILLNDDCVLAINKPSGLPTQAPRQFESVERRVRAWLTDRPPENPKDKQESDGGDKRPPYLGVPHRLDRPASGVLLLAKTPRAARIISRQFERRQIEKSYWACVSGDVVPPEGTWEDFVRKLPGVPKVEIVSATDRDALAAVLHYRVIGRTQYSSHLEIKLQTGRTHQIRIQVASRGHPVIGDQLYGSMVAFGRQDVDPRERAIALHARSITFRHPTTREVCTVTAPMPETWKEITIGSSA